MKKSLTLSPGDSYKSYVYTKVVPIKELQMVLYELTHTPTQARIIHLEADDPENLFCLSLNTLPTDSTGVAHILEHTVLCGSKKFPIKDPFFSMNRRSLNTFMNAMTGDDFTCYPAASQVKKDFYNLLEVYIDAIFYPELKEMSFLQEGHRLEFDPDLVHKGIVYNEMKGSLSNPTTRLWHDIMKHLTPELPYSYNSGGDPKDIPNLTWDELKSFHKTYYHPSRCVFFFYGNLPLNDHLDFIQKHALKDIKPLKQLKKISLQPRWPSPKTITNAYPSQTNNHFVSFAWLTTSITNQEDLLALAVIDSILMENDASPLKHALLQSKLCKDANSYLDTDMSEVPYIIICQGCQEDVRDQLKDIIINTLKNLTIKHTYLEAAIHQLEFSRLEITGSYGPFGLTLFMRSILAMQHGCEVEEALTIYNHFNTLRLRIKDPDYLPGIINKYLLTNTHYLEHCFSPDPKLEHTEQIEESNALKKLENTLSDSQKEHIKSQTQLLKDYQENIESQSIDCLPKITLSDVPTIPVHFHLEYTQSKHLTIFHHECFTNHILYAQVVFDLPYIDYNDLPYLQLLISLLPEIGAGGKTYQQRLQINSQYLGFFDTFLSFYPHIDNPKELSPVFGMYGKVLDQNIPELFKYLLDTCMSPDFSNHQRIKELILQLYTSLEHQVSSHAMSYAMQRSTRVLSLSSYIGDSVNGISYFMFIKNIVKNIDKHLPRVIEKCLHLKKQLFHFTNPHLIISCDEHQRKILNKEHYFGLEELRPQPYKPWANYSLPPSSRQELYNIPSSIAFSALGIYSEPLSPSLLLTTDLLENTYLHKTIREKGGAYGSGVSYNYITGTYALYSYRDPHIKTTFDAFSQGIENIQNGKFSDNDIIEAQLGILQDLDSPVSPGKRAALAYARFREGETKHSQEAFRDKLLHLTKKDITQAASKFLNIKNGVPITFAGESLLKRDYPDLSPVSLI